MTTAEGSGGYVRRAYPIVRDIVERVLGTAFAASLGVLTADGVNLIDLRNVSFWQGAGLVGLTAGWTLLKTLAAQKIGRKGGSLDPAVGVAPETAETRGGRAYDGVSDTYR